jgi:DNA end-binding protein Ku
VRLTALERNARARRPKFAWHGRERLGLLRVKESVIALHALEWPDEARSPKERSPERVVLTDTKLEEALLLIDSMTREEPVEDAEWATDRYTEALGPSGMSSARSQKPPQMETVEEPAGRMVNLMAALEQSVHRTSHPYKLINNDQ